MSDREWEKFFELLEKIVDLPMPIDEKMKLVIAKAAEDPGSNDALGNLEEFTAWNFEF